MAESYLGEIRMFAGNFAILNWATCDGQLLSISQNAALFSILGTQFGGDGQQTFALPDMRGRIPVHQGQGAGLPSYIVGQTAGAEKVTLSSQQMPSHTHSFTPQANNGGAANSRPAGGYPANTGNALYASATDGTAMGSQNIGATGGSQPFSVVQPVLCITFLISLAGIFPSRN